MIALLQKRDETALEVIRNEYGTLCGIRGVAFAALLGLSDFRKDAFAVGIHAGTHPFLPHKAISPANARLIFV